MAKSRLRSLAIGLSALVVASAAALAAGNFGTYPIVGGASFCSGYSTGSSGQVCVSTVPAGPTALTGAEAIPADTGLASGQQPQTVTIPSGLLFQHGNGAERNALRGGDFGTNLWQRGTSFASATPTTAAMTADGWWMYSSGNTVTVNRQTGASDIVLASGLRASLRVVRPSGTDVTPICVGQVLPATITGRFLGNNAVFSFWALAPATLTSTNTSVNVTIAYATAADSATPGTNTDAFAKATITGYTAVAAASTGTTGTASAGSVNVPLSTTWTRYSVYGAIPTTATTLGVKICMTNVGTGVAGDYFEIAGAQLEPTVTGVITPGGYARRNQATEASLEQSYSYGLVEQTGLFYANPVNCTSSGAAQIPVAFPSQMRITPTVTVTAGGFSIQTAAAVTAIGTTTLVTATTQQATLTSGAACTTTLPYVLKGTNTTGLLMFSAEP